MLRSSCLIYVGVRLAASLARQAESDSMAWSPSIYSIFDVLKIHAQPIE
jgi:hypothetical protein